MQHPVKHVEDNGTVRYLVGNDLHREDGPAVITPEGTEIWALNGVFHRIGGPAITYVSLPQSSKQEKITFYHWIVMGQMHREDGPAWASTAGAEEYWLEGRCYPTKEAHQAAVVAYRNRIAKV